MAMFRSPREVTSRPPMVNKYDREDGDGTIWCDFCFDGWESETEVDIHRKSAHSEELYDLIKDKNNHVCRICIRPHKDKDELVRHVKTWHLLSSEDASRVEREIFICDLCCTIFFNKFLLQLHILMYHSSIDKINMFTECPKCYKMCRVRRMWYHLENHNIQSVACCSICLTKCKNKKGVLGHLETHNKHLYCDMCNYESKNEAYFKEHLLTRHQREVETVRANLKWKQYFMPRDGDYRLNFQMNVPMKGLELVLLDEVNICVLCREICLGKRSMKNHIEEHHIVYKEPTPSGHMCTCGDVFYNKVLLKQHIFKAKGDDHRDAATVSPEHNEVYIVVIESDSDDVVDIIQTV